MMISAFLDDIKAAYKKNLDLESLLFNDFSDLHWIRHKNTGVLLCRRLPYLIFLHLPSPLLLPSTMVIVQLVYQPIYYRHNMTILAFIPTSCYWILVSSCTPTGLVVVAMSSVSRITLKSAYHQHSINCTILHSWSTILQLLSFFGLIKQFAMKSITCICIIIIIMINITYLFNMKLNGWMDNSNPRYSLMFM
jgi:hypothetical protein